MKKNLFLFVLLFSSCFAIGQILPADYDNAALQKGLNDSINMYYTVSGQQLVKLAGVEVIDSSLLRLGHYQIINKGLYKASFNAANEMEVSFARVYGGDMNRSPIKLQWAAWGRKTKSLMPQNGAPFPFTITGSASEPIIAPNNTIDTLFGYTVDMYDNPQIVLKVRGEYSTRIKLELIDKNGRTSNVNAPRHYIVNNNRDTLLVFRWDYLPYSSGWFDYKYSSGDNNDVGNDVGLAADGYSKKCWGVSLGREASTSPLLAGRSGWDGAALLDLHNIVGIAITIDDDNYQWLDWNESRKISKLVTIKQLIIGDYENRVDLTKENLPYSVSNSLPEIKLLSVSPSAFKQWNQPSITLKTTANAFAEGVQRILLLDSAGKPTTASNVQVLNDSTLSFNVFVAAPSLIGKYSIVIVTTSGQMCKFDSAVQLDEMNLTEPYLDFQSHYVFNKNLIGNFTARINGTMFLYGHPEKLYFKNKKTGETILTYFDTRWLSSSSHYQDFIDTYINASNSSEGVYDLEFEYMQNGRHFRKVHFDSVLTIIAPIDASNVKFDPIQMSQNQICSKKIYFPKAAFQNDSSSSVAFLQNGRKVFTARLFGSDFTGFVYIKIFTKNIPVGVYDLQISPSNIVNSIVVPNALTVVEAQTPTITPAIGNEGEWTSIKIAHPGVDAYNMFAVKTCLSKDGVCIFNAENDSIVHDTLYAKVFISESILGKYDVTLSSEYESPLWLRTVLPAAFSVTAKKVYELKATAPCLVKQGEIASIVLKLQEDKFKYNYHKVKFGTNTNFFDYGVEMPDSVSLSFSFGSANSPAGTYDIDVWGCEGYYSTNCIHYQSKQSVTIVAAPPIVVKSLSTNKIMQAVNTELILSLANVHIYSSDVTVEFRQDSTTVFIPTDFRRYSDSTLAMDILTDAPVGVYDLYVSTLVTGMKLSHIEKAALTVIPNKQPLTISQDTFFQGKYYYPFVRIAGTRLERAENVTIDVLKDGKILFFKEITSDCFYRDSVRCFMNYGYIPVGDYDLQLSYSIAGFAHHFKSPSLIKIVESPKPSISKVLQDTLTQFGVNEVTIHLSNAHYMYTEIRKIELIDRVSKRVMKAYTFKISDSVFTAYFKSPLVIGVSDLKITSSNGEVYPHLLKESCIRIIPNKVPKFISLSPAESMPNQTLQVQLKMQNAFFTLSVPKEIVFRNEKGYQISGYNVSVIDNNTLEFTVSNIESAGDYEMIFCYFNNGNESICVDKQSAYSIFDISKIKLLSCTPSSVLQGSTVDVFLKGKFTDFDEAFVNHNAVFRNGNAAIYPVDSVINDSVMRLRFTVSRYQKLGSYSLELEKSWSEYNDYFESYQYKSWNYPVLSDAIEVQINDKLPNLVDIETLYAQQGEHVTAIVNGVYTDFIKRPLRISYFRDDVYQFKPTSSSGLLMIDSVKALNATQMQISFTIPRTANVGRYSLLTYLNDDSLSLPHGFTVIENPNAPRLISVSKYEAKQGDTVCMTILGKGIGFNNSQELIFAISKPHVGFESKNLKIIDENTLETCFIVPDNIDEDTYDVLLNVKEKQSSQGIVEFYTLYDQFTIHATLKKPNQNTIGSSTGSGTGTGIDSQLSNKSTVIYPTTTTDKFTLSSPSAAMLEILNLTGQRVMSPSAVSSGETTFDVSELPASVYKVLVTSGEDTKIFTIVKQ